jgi:diguanylate cyclase (GGDEF)-like protein/PAS domain S-box-containing protein
LSDPSGKPGRKFSLDAEIRATALKALRNGDFDFALKAVERGEASIPDMVEDLKIYQAELEVQNDELREAQLVSEMAVQRFSRLFSSLPLPALVIDEFGVVIDCNELAVQRFNLNRKSLHNHFFPRLVKSNEHGRLSRLLEQAKSSGEDSMYEVAMQPVDSRAFIADIHASMLPDAASSTAHFAVIVVDQTQRLEQRASLEASRRHFMAYFEASPVGMASTSPSKGWIEVNDRLCHMLGYSHHELVRMTWLDLTHPDDIPADVAQFNRLLMNEIDDYDLDKRFIRKDGSILEAHLAVHCLRDRTGKVDYVVTIVESVAERKQFERELLNRDGELKNQAAQLQKRVKELSAMYVISRAAQQCELKETFLKLVLQHLPPGMLYPADTCVRISIRDKNYDSLAYVEPVFQIYATISVKGLPVGKLSVGYTKPHDALDKGPFYKEEQQFIDGIAELTGRFLERISAEQDRELTTKRNSALLDLTTQASDLGDLELLRHAIDQTESLTHSGMAYAHFVEDNQETLTLGSWSSNTLRNCDAIFDIASPPSKTGIWADCFRQKKWVIHNDYRALNYAQGLPEGHRKLQRHMSVAVMHGDKIVMIFGVGNKPTDYDIGDLALLEMVANNFWALLQRNQSHRKLELDAEVFRISREAVMITDASTNILSVNEAFTEITGYTREEAIGVTPRLLKSGQQDDLFYSKMWAEINQQGRWQGEIWNRRKNGEIYPQWLGITAAKNERGEVSEYIAIFMDIGDYKQAQDRIEKLAFYDPLTGLANRTLLRDRVQQALFLAQRNHHMAGLIYLDLDNFKVVNDSLGHQIGDELLVQVARLLVACVRDTDTVSRLGGDEFVVLLSDVGNPENVVEVSQKILKSMAKPFKINDHLITVTCSIGACAYPMDGEDFDVLLQRADTAMYQAKADGRNNWKLFTDEMNQQVQERLKLQTDMHLALKNAEFYVEYQPQFDLNSGKIIGAEALVRWHHPQVGLISPAEFIPIAEECGLILEIGKFVMQQACWQTRKWLDQGHLLNIAVNVSYVQFLRSNLLQLVTETLQQSGLPPAHLELELTESILVADPENVLVVVNQLREMGVFLSIDDFGTGYSSLSYLKRFAVHKLKIDQSFVRDILEDKEDAIIVSAIINLAKSLKIDCIAEGVESEEQANLLLKMGCFQIQGYWLGRPLSVEKMDNLLANQL